jgi:acyl-CoA thioesterase FadM|eukprot:COSAG06_NODE_4881_length_3883_cov_2.453777_2_plen_266_part_00
MKLPWVGNGYVAFEAHEPKMQRRLVMRSQYVKLNGGEVASMSSGKRVMGVAASAVDNDFTASCQLSKLGRTSLDLFYDLKVGDTTVGTGLSAMVCVAGETGARKPDPVPEAVHPSLVESPAAEAARADSVAVMEGFPLAADVVGDTYVYSTTIRYSDEDMNLHLWHSNTPKFFEDAYMTLKYAATDHPLSAIAQGPVHTILCEYISEGAAGDGIEVRLSSSMPNTLDVHMFKLGRAGGGHDGEDTEDALIGRGRMVCNGPAGAKL